MNSEAWVTFVTRAAFAAFVAGCAILAWHSLRPPAPSSHTASDAALEQAAKAAQKADSKIAAATVQVKHAKVVVKAKSKVSAQKLAAYQLEKKRIHKEGANNARPDLSVGASPEGPPSGAPEPQAVETVVAAADAALDAAQDENTALEEHAAALEALVDAHVEKETALENAQNLLKARNADLERENTDLQNTIFWARVALAVAAVITGGAALHALGML